MDTANDSDSNRRTNRHRAVVMIVTAVIVVAIIIAAAVAFAVTHGDNQADTNDGTSQIKPSQSDGATVTEPGENDKDKTEPAAKSDLPFTLDGVTTSGDTVEVSEGVNAATLANSWTFGGDFSQIGSVPIDATTVFGSTTSNPNNLTAYYAALLRSDGSTQSVDETGAGSGTPGATFYEPQDGTGNASRIVWRSSSINGTTQTGVDNWRLQTWDAAGNIAHTLGTAASLNGRDDTPQIYGEVVPTFNSSHAFFSSNVLRDGSWVESVLSFDLNASADTEPRVVGDGNFPAAVNGGVLYASDAAQKDQFRAYATLKYDDGQSATNVFTVHSDGDKWGISGVWAHGKYRAVSFSDGTADSGNYIGLWSDDFKTNLGWVHVKSASVVASMNDQWIVWGAGSQSENAGMYAFNWSSKTVKYLGSLAGYSRPTIASDNNTVMIPSHNDSDQAVSFTVGTLE